MSANVKTIYAAECLSGDGTVVELRVAEGSESLVIFTNNERTGAGQSVCLDAEDVDTLFEELKAWRDRNADNGDVPQ